MDKDDTSNRPCTRRLENGRLAYYRYNADVHYWDQHWIESIDLKYYKPARRGELGLLENIFMDYLPKGKHILEAGCGRGQIVLALRNRGFDVEGIEWAPRTVKKIRELLPELPIKEGNVCKLEVDDGYYGGYISIGVIEHRREGPEPFLAEAFRILEEGGVAIFTVPWFNPLRRVKGWLGCFKNNGHNPGEFYQYAYRAKEVLYHLRKAGFEIIDQSSYYPTIGFYDEIPSLYKLFKIYLLGRIIKAFIRRALKIFPYFGHSYIYVCRKPITIKSNKSTDQ